MTKSGIDWLTHPTGDPFADIGGFVIETLREVKPGSSTMDLIRFATEIYVNQWDNNLHSFFLNSTITHNSSKGQKGYDKTIAYFEKLLSDQEGEYGHCRITGKNGIVYNGARDNHIMSGSATLINFHHGFETGIKVSKEVLIRIFFVPLGVELIGDKIAVITSNYTELTRFIVRRNVKNNLSALGSNMSRSVLRSPFKSPVNALFRHAQSCIDDSEAVTSAITPDGNAAHDISLNLYHFTNFGASPYIELYTLPAVVFFFYAYCLQTYRRDWQRFVNAHYWSSQAKGATFDEDSDTWSTPKEIFTEETYKTWRNPVLESLLSGKPLTPLLVTYMKAHHLPFEIIEVYLTNLREMEKRTIQKIKQLADFIVDNRSDDEIKKFLTRLNGARNTTELRSFIVNLSTQNYLERKRDPLCSVDEFTSYLFPDGSNWRETRDVLLIAIYEKLHLADIRVETELKETENTSENLNP